MIIQPFTVHSKNKNYNIVDRDLLDSEAMKQEVNKIHGASLAYAQEGAKCLPRGIPDRQELDNRVLAVFDESELLGIFMLGSITYVSGPWENLQTWKVIDPGAAVLLEAVPMSGVFKMDPEVEEEFAADIADVILRQPSLWMLSGQGLPIGLSRLHYGMFMDHDDPISKRAQGQHAKAKLHPRLSIVETPHSTIVGLTIVEVRAK